MAVRDGKKAASGRRPAALNKATAVLKEAILEAAAEMGSDGEGEGGLVGYCVFLAKAEPKVFAGLIAKVLPMQVTGEDGGPIEAVTRVELVALTDDDGSAG
ncbi:UNVERIFIED_ORG: hypothetical protein LHK14_01665 [Roseateles sp. XES5]|nr:hypothetical protein [Roseateles sp. XES5]